MPITPWRAVCMQMPSQVATGASSRTEAWGRIQQNLDVAERMIDDVLAQNGHGDIRLLLFPEFAFQGPPLNENVPQWIDIAAEVLPGSISEPLQRKARDYGVFIGANQFEFDPEWPGRHFNCSFLIDPSGEVILRYRRIATAQWPSPHDFLDAYLDRYGVEGTFPVVDTELGRLAMIPCGEITVPEAARMFMMRGAEVLLHPDNASPTPVVDACKAVRAYENMVYLISTNVAGPVGFAANGQPLGGGSQIIDFNGNILSHEAEPAPSTAASAVIDVEKLREVRRDTGMRNRILRSRFETYAPIYESTVFYPANRFAEQPMESWQDTASIAEEALENLLLRRAAIGV